jgi:hypothetical protein
VGLAVAAAVVAARWYANRADELGRRRDFPLVSVVLLAVLAAGAATPGVLRARQERRLAADARALAVAYWRTVYPAMPDGDRSTACRPGGTLDEHLPNAPWAPGS